MNWLNISLRGLQTYCVLSAIVAFIGGGTYLLHGFHGLVVVLGSQMPDVASQLGTAVNISDNETRGALDLGLRSLAWYWLVTGGMMLWITPNVLQHTTWFRAIHVGFMAVGVATVIGIIESGNTQRAFALIPEFGIPLLAMVWQGWLSHRYVTTSPAQL